MRQFTLLTKPPGGAILFTLVPATLARAKVQLVSRRADRVASADAPVKVANRAEPGLKPSFLSPDGRRRKAFCRRRPGATLSPY
jgi:hypothetical protein